ncbi:hypothetical protein [Pseudomonas sp. 2FG]|uniref:hypothetical protein n=1 Tax=Pseudomonas sp. 2FG TaxID=2502191 RepID=UPI0010F622EE|nr:hypothetical protein [Pseudomonas sp. 2FG]
MSVVRFIVLLFAFIGVLVGCAVAVLIGIVMLRFLPALIIAVLTCTVFWWLLKKAAVLISIDSAQ